jgi:hypothetical protein
MRIKTHDPAKHDTHEDGETHCAQFTLLLVENRGEMRKRHPFQFFDGSGHKELLNFVENEHFSKFICTAPLSQTQSHMRRFS